MNHPLDHVETSLYDRMLRNAFIGFGKSALIGGVIGAVVGAVLFATGLFPQHWLPGALESLGKTSPLLAGAAVGAAVSIPTAGAFGAVAGIQSTRDARRYLHADEIGRSIIPPTQDVLASVTPEAMGIDTRDDHTERLKSEKISSRTPGVP